MGESKFFSVRNMTDTKAEIYIYGDIVSSDWEKWSETDVCPADIKEAVNNIGGRDVDIHIYSAGGSVFAGEAIRSILLKLTGYKTVYIDGLAASIASAIAMCYDELHISEGSYMVIHNPSTYAWGTANDLRKTAETLDLIKETIMSVYNGKLSEDFDNSRLSGMLDDETWLTANDVKLMFKSVVIDEGAVPISAKLDNNMLQYFNKLPDDIMLPEKQEDLINTSALRDALECERMANNLKLLRSDAS